MGHSRNQTCLYLQMLQTTTRSLLWWDIKKIDLWLLLDLEAFLRSTSIQRMFTESLSWRKISQTNSSAIFVTILNVGIYNICKYKQNHCVCFREWPINFWGVNIAKFHCFIRNFAQARCTNFEKIVFVYFESQSSSYPIFSFIDVFLTENEFFQNELSI